MTAPRHCPCGTAITRQATYCRPCLALASRRPIPADFAQYAAIETNPQLSERYNTGIHTLRKWRERTGIASPYDNRAPRRRPVRQSLLPRPPKPSPPSAKAFSPVRKPVGDGSRAGLAAEYLRRFGAVYRCNEIGRQDPKGAFWRRGTAVLTSAELIERAERNGWRPHAWKEIGNAA